MTLVSLWQDRHPRTPIPGRPSVSGDWDVVVVGGGLTGADHRAAARPGRPVGGAARGRPRRRRHHRPQHRQAQPAPGHPAVPDRPSALRRRSCEQYVEAQRRGRWPGSSGSATTTTSRVQHRPAYTFATSASGARAGPRGVRRGPRRPGCRSPGSTGSTCRSRPTAASGCRTSCSSTRWSCSTSCRCRPPRTASTSSSGARVRRVTRPRPGRGRHRRRLRQGRHRRARDEHADPRPGRLLRAGRAGAVLRPGLPDAGAGRGRDVPLGGSADPVAPRRPRPGRPRCCSSAATATRPVAAGPRAARIEELRAWTAAHFPRGRGDARVVGPGLRAAPRAAVRRPAAAGLRRAPGRPAATRSGA